MTCDLQPTYRGIIASAEDAITLVEACLSGYISCVPHHPSGEEIAQVIRSGNIFIYEENASRIKRWVDGVSWCLGRAANGCVWYRQVDITRSRLITMAKGQKAAVESKHSPASIEARPAVLESWADIHEKNNDLFPTDSNTTGREKPVKSDYTENGLVKKIMSITVGSMTHRLISYYSAADVPEQGKLQRPSKDPELIGLKIRQELLEQYCNIPFGKHGRQDKDWYSLKSNAGTPALNPIGDTSVPALDQHNLMSDADMLALASYDPTGDTGDTGVPALDPMGDVGTPELDYDTMTGNGEDQDFKMP